MVIDADCQSGQARSESIHERGTVLLSSRAVTRTFQAAYRLVGWAALGFVVVVLLNTATGG